MTRDISPDLVKRTLEQRYGATPEDAQRAVERLAAVVKGQILEGSERGFEALASVGQLPPIQTVTLNSAFGVQHHYRTATAGAGVITRYSRPGDSLELTINLPPRTKKNSTTLGKRQSVAYRAYRDAIVDGVAWVNEHHDRTLPPFLALPDRELGYNIAAIYYVDPKGRAADKCGLDQGLYDALENSGIVSDDWYFRTDDGTRIVLDDPNPRVEISITPIE
jgi:hypothetical protein